VPGLPNKYGGHLVTLSLSETEAIYAAQNADVFKDEPWTMHLQIMIELFDIYG
jgi:hypothetical protein